MLFPWRSWVIRLLVSLSYRFIPDQESRALQTCHQHLMSVPGHRVDSYQTQATQQRIYVDDSVVRSKMLLWLDQTVHLWMPFNKCLCFLDIRAAPPQQAWWTGKRQEAFILKLWQDYWKWMTEWTHVHMQPQVVLLTYVCDFINGIKSSEHCGPCCGVYHDGHGTLNTHTQG